MRMLKLPVWGESAYSFRVLRVPEIESVDTNREYIRRAFMSCRRSFRPNALSEVERSLECFALNGKGDQLGKNISPEVMAIIAIWTMRDGWPICPLRIWN